MKHFSFEYKYQIVLALQKVGLSQILVWVNGWPFPIVSSMGYWYFFTEWIGKGILTNFIMVTIFINLLLAWKYSSKELLTPGKVTKFAYLLPPIFTMIVCLCGFSYMYYLAFNVGDYQLTNVQNAVGFKLFSPNYIPEGFRLRNFYINSDNQIAGQTTVQTVIDPKFKYLLDGRSGFYIVRQARVGSDFSLKQYAGQVLSKRFEIKKVEVGGREGYLANMTMKTSTISELFFYLDENTVGVIATDLEEDHLEKIARSMR